MKRLSLLGLLLGLVIIAGVQAATIGGGGSSGGGGTQYAEDTAHSSGDTGTMTLCVRRDANTTLADTTGDYAPCQTDANGNLKVNVVAGGGTGGVSVAEDTAHSAGENITPIGCRRIDSAATSAGTSGDWATVDCDASGRLRTDTEMPDAAALADNTANPTVPGVAAYIMCYDGSTWDRCVATDNTAHDAVDAGSPLKIGAKASNATSSRTSVANNDRTDIYAGIDGILITRPYANLEDRVSGLLANTDGASTAVVAAQGAGIRFCATTVIVSNSSATNVTVDLRDGTAGSVLATIPAAANMGGAVIQLPVPLCTTANTALAMDGSAAATTVTVTAIGFKTAL